ncbi:MAG: LL-diaminopimelate aminotransferase [Bacteroidaceae bacterium]|nr:LL-diaminopimelate aminotransferase [Bacteroidaceae bacterium]
MIHTNTNYTKLSHRYLFAEIAQQVNAYKAEHPEADIIRLGIGDVTRPLPPAAIQAMHRAVDECADGTTFRGYGPEQGYDFLIDAIIQHDFTPRGIQLDRTEVFISDGAKSDTGNIGDILATDNIVGITDPVYPVYVDTNIMAGRTIRYIPCHADNGFTGDIPSEHLDIIYLCYPNNPTGTVITKEKLTEWVNYALREKALILYDSAYEAFIQDDTLPHSIYEIEGAKQCAIEFRSFSKTAGFTGIRCGYTIIPKELKGADGTSLNALWNRRQCSKFNGASYISQRGAEAIFTPEGQQQVRATIQHYMKNAQLIRESLAFLGLTVYGGEHSPYIWVSTPDGEDSWHFFHRLLTDANVVVTPGEGFGHHGEGYVRITAFGTWENSLAAMERIKGMI